MSFLSRSNWEQEKPAFLLESPTIFTTSTTSGGLLIDFGKASRADQITMIVVLTLLVGVGAAFLWTDASRFPWIIGAVIAPFFGFLMQRLRLKKFADITVLLDREICEINFRGKKITIQPLVEVVIFQRRKDRAGRSIVDGDSELGLATGRGAQDSIFPFAEATMLQDLDRLGKTMAEAASCPVTTITVV